jgi:hypothetical protein
MGGLSMGKQALSVKYSEVVPKIMEIAGIKEGHGAMAQLARVLGVEPQSLNNFRNKNQLPLARVQLFCLQNNIPVETLIDGGKHMGITKEDGFREKTGVVDKALDISSGVQLVISIPYGTETWRSQHKDTDRLNITLEVLREWVDNLFTKEQQRNLMAWLVDGDNMEPALHRGAVVLIDTTDKNIGTSGIFAFQTNGNLAFRRLYPRLDGNVDVINDNRAYPSMNTPPQLITENPHMRIIGRVIFCGNKI